MVNEILQKITYNLQLTEKKKNIGLFGNDDDDELFMWYG